MKAVKIALISGALVTVGVIAAISAPGPRGDRGAMWGETGLDGPARPGGLRGWFKPKSLTVDEYDTRTRERFARLDKNGDGVIDTSEIEAALSGHAGHGPQAAGDAERFIREFGDRDGKVTKTAYLAEVKRRFGELDLNNDGKITDDDLPPALRGLGLLKANGPAVHGPMGRMLAALRQADANQDGVITVDAVLAAESKRFDGLDRNKDGVVENADVDQVKKEMVDYGVRRFLHAYGSDADGKVTKDQYYKVAKERFARLDRKGEGRIEFGPPGGRNPGGRWFTSKPDAGHGGPDNGPGQGPPPRPQPRD